MDLLEARFFISMTALCSLLALEWYWPKRQRSVSRTRRWGANLALIAISSLCASLSIGSLPTRIAEFSNGSYPNLLSYLQWGETAQILLTICLMDLLIYLQHIMFHAVPLFWRLHMVHHADPDLDVSSGLRFHPLEIVLSLLIKALAALVIGVHPVGYFIFEVLLNLGSLFNHSNINIRGSLDQIIRMFIVTPDMHRIHHSVVEGETNSNFGFTVSFWDRLFGTYKESAFLPQSKIEIGLKQVSPEQGSHLGYLLLLPFLNIKNSYSLKKD